MCLVYSTHCPGACREKDEWNNVLCSHNIESNRDRHMDEQINATAHCKCSNGADQVNFVSNRVMVWNVPLQLGEAIVVYPKDTCYISRQNLGEEY